MERAGAYRSDDRPVLSKDGQHVIFRGILHRLGKTTKLDKSTQLDSMARRRRLRLEELAL